VRIPLRRALPGALIALVALAVPASVLASFPSYDSRYHDYAEMVAEIQAAESDHPSIVDAFSIGKSYQNRTIWAAKISDNVGTDENEPEVLFDALHHAREHFTVEQALYILDLLADGYGSDSTITSLVDRREIFIVFMVNPDGGEYDIATGKYRAWRKNRQPNAGSSYVGTDLNRNYDYRWGCCGGSSGTKSSITYRGPRAFSAPETRVIRDFVNSRIIGGRQQIRAHITFHTNGKLILWPYGYTKTNIPADMTRADYNAFAAIGKAMAAKNGYKAQQSSDLYITDGDQIDWMYGRHRIFSYTVELYPPETNSVWTDHYPPDEKIAPETARNKSAILYFLEQAGCPWRASGKADTNCGPLYDDFEGDQGWRLETAAVAGAWARGNPEPVSNYGAKQLDGTISGRYALATGLRKGSSWKSGDVDGITRIRSRVIDLPAGAGPLTFRYVFAHRADPKRADHFRVQILDVDSGERTTVFEVKGSNGNVNAIWRSASVSLAAFEGSAIRIVIEARDGGLDTGVEAAVDDIRIERGSVPLP
jgi:hypothetical protein